MLRQSLNFKLDANLLDLENFRTAYDTGGNRQRYISTLWKISLVSTIGTIAEF